MVKGLSLMILHPFGLSTWPNKQDRSFVGREEERGCWLHPQQGLSRGHFWAGQASLPHVRNNCKLKLILQVPAVVISAASRCIRPVLGAMCDLAPATLSSHPSLLCHPVTPELYLLSLKSSKFLATLGSMHSCSPCP